LLSTTPLNGPIGTGATSLAIKFGLAKLPDVGAVGVFGRTLFVLGAETVGLVPAGTDAPCKTPA
jgi:hypothetical protein